MVLLRYLVLLAVHHSFSFITTSVCGKANPIVDALSCFQFQGIRHLAPGPTTKASSDSNPPSSTDSTQVTRRRDVTSFRALLPLQVRCTCLPSVAILIFADWMAVLVQMVLFCQLMNSLLCVLHRFWLTASTTHPSSCTSV